MKCSSVYNLDRFATTFEYDPSKTRVSVLMNRLGEIVVLFVDQVQIGRENTLSVPNERAILRKQRGRRRCPYAAIGEPIKQLGPAVSLQKVRS